MFSIKFFTELSDMSDNLSKDEMRWLDKLLDVRFPMLASLVQTLSSPFSHEESTQSLEKMQTHHIH